MTTPPGVPVGGSAAAGTGGRAAPGRGAGSRLVVAAVLAAAVAGISLAAPIGAACAAPALAVAFWRTALAAAVTAPVAVLHRPRGPVGVPGGSAARHATLAGLLLAVHFGLWLPSLRLTSVAASTALVTTTPLWTVLADRLRGRRVPRGVVLGCLVALAGVLTVTGVDLGVSTGALVGDLLALLGGAAAAGYVAAGERARAALSTARYTGVAYTVAAAALGLGCLVAGASLTGYPGRAWVELGAMTLAAQLLGHTGFNLVLPRVGATVVALAILLEVPGAALVAWAWLGQRPPLTLLPGLALVLAGLAVAVWSRRAPAGPEVTPGPR